MPDFRLSPTKRSLLLATALCWLHQSVAHAGPSWQGKLQPASGSSFASFTLLSKGAQGELTLRSADGKASCRYLLDSLSTENDGAKIRFQGTQIECSGGAKSPDTVMGFLAPDEKKAPERGVIRFKGEKKAPTDHIVESVEARN